MQKLSFHLLVLIPYDTEIPSYIHSLWIETFFDIQNCIVQWTSLSISFCQALINNGLIHFFESELDKFTKKATAVTNHVSCDSYNLHDLLVLFSFV